MKVFISWSGETSKQVAEILKSWFPKCIQTLQTFLSSEDIEKGENWNAKLTGELATSNFGIVCLTEENISAPWIHFEAGALSKMLNSKVSAFLFNVDISDIKGPLSSFQATKFSRDDVRKLLQSINNESDTKISDEILFSSFDAFWPQLEKEIKNVISSKRAGSQEKKAKPNQSDILEEILQLSRSTNSSVFEIRDATKLSDRFFRDDFSSRSLRFDDIIQENFAFFRQILELSDRCLDLICRDRLIDACSSFSMRLSRYDERYGKEFASFKRYISSKYDTSKEEITKNSINCSPKKRSI